MIVIDTHTLIWWVSDDAQLSKKAKKIIEKELRHQDGQILVSSITAWEISMLVAKDRLTLAVDVDTWLSLVENIDNVSFVPIDNKVAIESTRLPGDFHKDPADRMIVALARTAAAPLVTADDKIRSYSHVKTIW